MFDENYEADAQFAADVLAVKVKADKPYYIRATGAFQRQRDIQEFARVVDGRIVNHCVVSASGRVIAAPDEINFDGNVVHPAFLARLGFRKTGSIPDAVRIFSGENIAAAEVGTESEPPKESRAERRARLAQEADAEQSL